MDDPRSMTESASGDEPLFRRGAWGRLATALLPLVALTGLAVAFAYRPDPLQAWWSVAAIRGSDLGVLRDLHRWGGELLVVAVWLHLFRVFMVGAYRRLPGWQLSVVLTVLVVASAASGWVLRHDAGARGLLAELGGGGVGGGGGLVIAYVLHVVVLPAAIVGSVWVWTSMSSNSSTPGRDGAEPVDPADPTDPTEPNEAAEAIVSVSDSRPDGEERP